MKSLSLLFLLLTVGAASIPAEAAVMKCAVNPTACPRGNHLQCKMTHGWCGPACGATFCSDGPASHLQMERASLASASPEASSALEFLASAEAQSNPWNDLNDEAVYDRAKVLATKVALGICRAKDPRTVAKRASEFALTKVRDNPFLRVRAEASFRCVAVG